MMTACSCIMSSSFTMSEAYGIGDCDNSRKSSAILRRHSAVGATRGTVSGSQLSALSAAAKDVDPTCPEAIAQSGALRPPAKWPPKHNRKQVILSGLVLVSRAPVSSKSSDKSASTRGGASDRPRVCAVTHSLRMLAANLAARARPMQPDSTFEARAQQHRHLHPPTKCAPNMQTA